MDLSLYHGGFDLFCDHITKGNASILDIACGPGNISSYITTKRVDFNILGIDLSINMVKLARVNNPTVEFKVMDCKDIASIEDKYDGIMCGFCLPYLSKKQALQLISDVALLLNSDGIFYLSTMMGDYSQSGFQSSSSGDKMYIHYHQEDYLLEALKQTGFKIIDLQQMDSPENATVKTSDLIIIAKYSTE
ncbi:MAG: class I SAM-dependent methyltransferase [Alcanivoracaceae bacterium]|nr:class I SAM-dependent methyltransferase [Alcanivoracaceae bacterium]